MIYEYFSHAIVRALLHGGRFTRLLASAVARSIVRISFATLHYEHRFCLDGRCGFDCAVIACDTAV